MLKLLMNISSVVFLVCAVTYLPLFFRFQSDLKGAVQKSPDLFNINGLGEAVRLIFDLSRRPEIPPRLRTQAVRLKRLLLVGWGSFAVMVAAAIAK